MADATTSRTHRRLIRFAISNAEPETVAVLRSVPSTPPLPTQDGKPPARPRLATGLPLDVVTLYATFGHASYGTPRTTCAAYNIPTLKTTATCATCAISNIRQARTYHSSRNPAQHTTGSSWSGDLIGPVHTQSHAGAVYGLHLTEHKTAIAKIPSLRAVSVRAAVLGLVVDEEAGGVVERTALGWILASKKTRFPPLWVKAGQLSDSDS